MVIHLSDRTRTLPRWVGATLGRWATIEVRAAGSPRQAHGCHHPARDRDGLGHPPPAHRLERRWCLSGSRSGIERQSSIVEPTFGCGITDTGGCHPTL